MYERRISIGFQSSRKFIMDYLTLKKSATKANKKETEAGVSVSCLSTREILPCYTL